jgi:hypothetical protein
VHIALVGALFVFAANWFLQEGQGARTVSGIWANLTAMQNRFARSVPFPSENSRQ